MIDNPELIFDDHARNVAGVFGLAHLLKIQSKTDDFGGVVMLYTSKEAIDNMQALEQCAFARAFSHTIPQLITSHCIMTPFQLPLASILNVFKGSIDEASHVLLWVVSGGQYRIIAHHVNESRRQKLRELRGDDKTYCTESYGFAIDPAGNGPIALAARTGLYQFIPDAGAPDERALRTRALKMKRAPLLTEFGIRDVYFVPISSGILEFGLPKTPKDVAMEEIERFTSSQASKVFSYLMFWSKSDADGMYHIVADHVCESRRRKLRELRGDDQTFASRSYGFALDPSSNGPIATAARTGKQQLVHNASECTTFKRRALAEEFGIESVFFVPSTLGVLEYGTPKYMLDESGTSVEATLFVTQKVREIEKSNKVAQIRADKARRFNGGTASLGLGKRRLSGDGIERSSTLASIDLKETAHRVLHKMRGAKGLRAPKVRLSWAAAATSFCTWLGVFITLLVLSGADQLTRHLSDGQFLVILGSWGALMTLLFSAPASPLVQPRNVFGGNLVSASVAILFNYLTGEEYLNLVPRWLALALAPASAISAMQFLGVSHPPAGAVSLIFITGSPLITGMHWAFLLCPLLLGNVLAVLLASCINNLSSKRQYPMYW